jgi:mRNA interferase YafQ
VRAIVQTKQFKKDYKKVARSNRYSVHNFIVVLDLLIHDKPLEDKYRDHRLVGAWQGCRECHIKPDWLLIYKQNHLELILLRTGSHSELFA